MGRVMDPPDAGGRRARYRAASLISYTINPLVLPVIGVALVVFWGGGSGYDVARVAGIASVFFALVPLAVVWVLLRKGHVDSLDIRVRRKRVVPFIAGVASFAAGLLTLAGVDTPAGALVVALTLCLIINTVLMTLITLRWKISIHGAGVGGLLGLLLFLITIPILPTDRPPTGLFIATIIAAVAVPAVVWARIHLGAHTIGQAVTGAVAGIFLPWIELYLLWSTGYLIPI